MRSPRPPKVNPEAIGRARQSLTEIDQLKARFRQFEKQRSAGELSTQFIALEALAALFGGRVSGFSDADLRRAWPKDWGEEVITVPATIAAALAIAWRDYRSAPSGVTLGEKFGLEGGGQGSQPTRNRQLTKDRDRRRANEVELVYLMGEADGRTISIDDAIKIVAEREGTSFETIRAAHKKYRREIRDSLADLGILGG
jgi:hypothetical protein